jgi:protocatechuate 3,4-dioxygenase beta subunit
MALVISGCSGDRQDALPAQRSGTDAVQSELSVKSESVLDAIRAEIERDAAAVQQTLLDPQFTAIRDTEAFRAAIRDAVVRHKISKLTLAPPDEPGQWVEIEGQVVESENNPVQDAVVDVFGTDDDDPLLQEPQNAEQREEATRVHMEKPNQEGVANGTVVLPMH